MVLVVPTHGGSQSYGRSYDRISILSIYKSYDMTYVFMIHFLGFL